MNPRIRGLLPLDRAGLEVMLTRVKEFDGEDCALAMELVEIVLTQPHQKDYRVDVALGEGGRIEGFICYGPTPLTEGTFDLYWIAVDPDCAGRGIGTGLLAQVEESLRCRGGRLLLIETSSSPIYERTRHFYLKNGYALVDAIPDFYRPGEDRVTYLKRLK